MTDHLGTVHFKNASGYPQCGAVAGEAAWSKSEVTCKACIGTFERPAAAEEPPAPLSPAVYGYSLHERGTPLTPVEVAQRAYKHLMQEIVVPVAPSVVSGFANLRVGRVRDTLTPAHRIVVHPEVEEIIRVRLYDEVPRGAWTRLICDDPGSTQSWPNLRVCGVLLATDAALRLDALVLRLDVAL